MSVAGYIGKNIKEMEFPREGTDDLGVPGNAAVACAGGPAGGDLGL